MKLLLGLLDRLLPGYYTGYPKKQGLWNSIKTIALLLVIVLLFVGALVFLFAKYPYLF